MTKKIRPMGAVLLDVELIMDELIDQHELQWGDVLNIIHGYMQVHNPDAQEEYMDGSHPVFYYGPDKGESE